MGCALAFRASRHCRSGSCAPADSFFRSRLHFPCCCCHCCYQLIDNNKDNFLDIADLAAYLASMGEIVGGDVIKAMLATADADGDGKVGFEDFQKLARTVDA